MHRSIVPSLLLIVLFFGTACDRTHPADGAVRGFLDAVQYGDVDGAFQAHIDSSPHSD